MKIIKLFLLGLLVNNTAFAADLPDRQAELVVSPKKVDQTYLTPRPLSSIPAGEFGDKVRQGYQLFVNTQQLRDKYVGNELNCANCHMAAGGKANAAPLWGAYFSYPAYRKKNDKVNSYEERIQGCFNYSMNGKAPAKGSPELVALSAYSYWLGMGGMMDMAGDHSPVPALSDKDLLIGGKRDDFPMPDKVKSLMTMAQRAKLPGKGYPPIPKPAQSPSIERGEQVYKTSCASCHGMDGLGHKIGGIYALPPLWGSQSFNWGAGMHRINTAAYFIYENMPLGKATQLSNQEAWDVAAYMNSHERPQDPRFKGDVKKLQQTYHKHEGFYGHKVNGKVLGTEAYPNNPKKVD